MSIPVPFTENLLQPDIPNEVDKVCVVKTRKQSTGEVMHIFKDFLSKPQRNYELIVAFHTIFSVEFLEQEFICELGSMPVGAPLDRLGTDLLGPLPVTPRGNKYILTITPNWSVLLVSRILSYLLVSY
jgi:hypothetical protein